MAAALGLDAVTVTVDGRAVTLPTGDVRAYLDGTIDRAALLALLGTP